MINLSWLMLIQRDREGKTSSQVDRKACLIVQMMVRTLTLSWGNRVSQLCDLKAEFELISLVWTRLSTYASARLVALLPKVSFMTP